MIYLFLLWLNLLSATETLGKIRVEIICALNISKLRDLDFGDGFLGDGPKTIAPNEGAYFLVTGEPNKSFQVILPKEIKLVGKPSSNKIAVNNFISTAASALSNEGSQKIGVGATRQSLSASLSAGDYSGQFTVSVVY